VRNLIVSVAGLLPVLGVAIALRMILAVTITMVAVAVWPFIPRLRRVRKPRRQQTLSARP
jgi:hypothetical protein